MSAMPRAAAAYMFHNAYASLYWSQTGCVVFLTGISNRGMHEDGNIEQQGGIALPALPETYALRPSRTHVM